MSRFNYFSVILVDGYAYPTQPQADFGFNSQAISFLNRGSATIYYSFNGTDDDGDLNPADASKGIFYDFRAQNHVWFRAEGGLTSSVRVEAWRGRN